MDEVIFNIAYKCVQLYLHKFKYLHMLHFEVLIRNIHSWRPNFNIEEEKFNVWTIIDEDQSNPSCQCFNETCLRPMGKMNHHALILSPWNFYHHTLKVPLLNHQVPPKQKLSTKDDIFDHCSNVLVNSSIAKACGPFLDRDIMYTVDICVSGTFNWST